MECLRLSLPCLLLLLTGCPADRKDHVTHPDITYQSQPVSTFWKNATVYFLLTDRFHNGDPSNDQAFDRQPDGALLRNFEGGDLAGITKKIEEGYFDSLGVNAIWLTPVFEQIRSHTDEGSGKTYAYHGYWTRDWTALDPNFGTMKQLKDLVNKAHTHGIRIMLDAVINHTGPVTRVDHQWPEAWVRVDPDCRYQNFVSTVECTLVDNLPDIRTESTREVSIPDFLVEKWKQEGRRDQEISGLEQFFQEKGYPRYPFYYIVYWLTKWVRELGIDGFRIDTAKHTEAYVWSVLKIECEKALNAWRRENPDLVIHDDPFFMVGEVYGYGASAGREYDYGDIAVDFFNHGFESLINFEFKRDAESGYETIFSKYSTTLNAQDFSGLTIMNYLSSHDDGDPFDKDRTRGHESANKLLLSPGTAQIYYGDETARPLEVPGASGDANLRSLMNWEDLISRPDTRALLKHWQKLGRFRSRHTVVGSGMHEMITETPYTFKRYLSDGDAKTVVIGLDHPSGVKTIPVDGIFEEGTMLRDYYSGISVPVQNGQVTLNNEHTTVLLAIP